MPPFESTEEFLHAVKDLMTRLRAGGHDEAVVALKQGFKYMNGMPDGWALLLSSLDTVHAKYAPKFAPEDREALAGIHAEVYAKVTSSKG